MIYKIEITAHNDGIKVYRAFCGINRPFYTSWQRVRGVTRFYTDDNGPYPYTSLEFDTREEAMAAIDKHYGKQVNSIQVEYIKKP